MNPVPFLQRAFGVVAASFLLTATAQANIIEYSAFLSGPAESPPNASPGSGAGFVWYDDVAHTLRVNVTFFGLLGNTTVAHIHAPTAAPLTGTAGVATQTPTFVGFPAGVTSGSYDHTFNLLDTSTYNASFVTANGNTAAGAEAALVAALNAGKSYLNVHSSLFGSGEIRGFLTQVPDQAQTAGLLLLGLAGLGAFGIAHRPKTI